MKFVLVDQLTAGNRLASDIHDYEGRLILREGIALNERMILSLKRLHIHSVYIIDDTYKGFKLEEGLGERFRIAAISALSSAFDEIKYTGDFRSKPLIQMANDVADASHTDSGFAVQTKDNRNEGAYLFPHSANVCMLSVLTAKGLGYNSQQIEIQVKLTHQKSPIW